MKKRILLIDDSVTSKNNLEIMFETVGAKSLVEIHYSNNAFDGIAKVTTLMPDLIIMDWHMDELDGLEATFILKNNNDYKDIPIIILSGDGNIVDKAGGYLMGADDFLAKGLSYEAYFSIVNRYLGINV